MTTDTETMVDLEKTIAKALKKIGSKKESDVCKYLPGEGNAHMHHLSYRHLKLRDPKKVDNLLDTHILNKTKPKALQPPSRAPRKPTNKSGSLRVSPELLKRVAEHLEAAGEHELLVELEPVLKSERQIVRELIAAIKRREKPASLWEAYVRRVARNNE